MDSPYAVAVDANNDVIVTGASASDWECVTIKYSNDGVLLWINRDLGAQVVKVGLINRVLAVDGNNNIFVTGATTFSYDTIKYSSAGLSIWTNRYRGPSVYTDPSAVAVDSDNNVIVTGVSDGNFSKGDYATIKYSSNGLPLWTNRFNGLGDGEDRASAVVVDRSGNAFVTGSSRNRTNFDYGTIAYSGAGVPLWTNLYNGPRNGDDVATALAVDRSGNVFVTGNSHQNGTNYEYVTIKYSVRPAPIPLGFQTLNHQLVLSWTNVAFGLQSAPNATVTFTNIPGAASPYTNRITGEQQYFRLISN